MSKPTPLVRKVSQGESTPFDGVLLNEWAAAELYTQRDLCTEVSDSLSLILLLLLFLVLLLLLLLLRKPRA